MTPKSGQPNRPAVSVMNEIISPMTNKILSRLQKAELLKEIAANPNIPSPPTVVLQVLDQASRPIARSPISARSSRSIPGWPVASCGSSTPRPLACRGRWPPFSARSRWSASIPRDLLGAHRFPFRKCNARRASSTRNGSKIIGKASVAGAIVARELSKKSCPRSGGRYGRRLVARSGRTDPAAVVSRWLRESPCRAAANACSTANARSKKPIAAWITPRSAPLFSIAGGCRRKSPRRFGIIMIRSRCLFSSPQRAQRAYLLHFATRASQVLQAPRASRTPCSNCSEPGPGPLQDEPRTILREFLVPLERTRSPTSPAVCKSISAESTTTKASWHGPAKNWSAWRSPPISTSSAPRKKRARPNPKHGAGSKKPFSTRSPKSSIAAFSKASCASFSSAPAMLPIAFGLLFHRSGRFQAAQRSLRPRFRRSGVAKGGRLPQPPGAPRRYRGPFWRRRVLHLSPRRSTQQGVQALCKRIWQTSTI